MEEIKQTPHVVLLPSPGMGHLIPLIEFAKRIVFHRDLLVTFLIPTDGSSTKAQETVLNSLPKSINYIYLPPVNFDDLPDDVQIETRIFLTITRSLSFIRVALKNLMANSNIVALVLDCFGMDAYDVAKEFNLPHYVFFTSAAMGLLFNFELPNLDATYSGEYRDMPEPLKLPGCVPLHGVDFIDPCQDRKSEAYAGVLQQSKRYKLAEGILVNSFLELELGAFNALQEEHRDRPSVYPVGPLISTGDDADGSGCLKWLSDQPRGSVLYVSFGSGGTLSSEQMTELAFGLEMSGHRFLWVVKNTSDTAVNASYFNAQSVKDPFDFLPKGFIERTKGRGLMVPAWAPQIQVLSHGSTGGFLTHCGWNSTLESIVHGVPLIAWPLYAEQKMNAVMLHDMRIALRLNCDENGIICRNEISQVVQVLMEGEEGKKVRNKMEDLKHVAAAAYNQNGSSAKSLCEVTFMWKSKSHIIIEKK